MTLARRTDDQSTYRGEVLPRNVIPYSNQSNGINVPSSPPSVPQQGGLTGLLFGDRQARKHERNLRDVYYLGRECLFALHMGAALEIHGTQVVLDSCNELEAIVAQAPPGSFAHLVATDVASQAGSRLRSRHDHLASHYDAQTLNIISRR